MNTEKRIECIVSGRVQMVMYRDFATRNARQLGVRGFVKNESDGTVKIVAEGDEDILNKFLARLHRGPILADVLGLSVSWGDPTGEFLDFTICY